MPKVEGHHDFGVLESRLAALVREAARGAGRDLLPAVAIVAPTSRLLAHLRLRLAEISPALLNVHFFTHQTLAEAAVAARGGAWPPPLSEDVRIRILAGIIQSRGGALADYAAARPGSVASILSTLDDLREAGAPAGAASRARGLTARGREILDLYAAYAGAIDLLGARAADRARLLLEAAPAVRDLSRRFALVVHYGAYDLIGVNLALMRAVEESGARLVFLAPHHPLARAFEEARRFWPEMLGTEPEPLTLPPSGRLLADRLPLLYEEDAQPGPLEEASRARVEAFHAQGAAAELREVALRILALDRGTIPLHRIGVVARTLQPYAALLRPVFEAHALPFTTSAALGARREARAQAALQLARAVLRDFPRQALVDLCRGGLLRLKDLDASRHVDAWDRLSRDWHVGGGHLAWTRDLPSWIEEWRPYVPPEAGEEAREGAQRLKAAVARQARTLSSAVEELRRAARPLASASSWTEWSEAFDSLLAGHLTGFAPGEEGQAPDAGAAAVLRILAEMRHLDEARLPFDTASALAFFEEALGRAGVPIGAVGGAVHGADNGGVRILDAMQARGLSFEVLFLIGLNADLLPRRATEDPFLPDADRRLLRERLRVPLPVGSAAIEEERLLLAHLLGAAGGRLVLSWQRADESGRARVPSLALREIARLVDGEPDLQRFVSGARRVPAHPSEAGADALGRFGLLPAGDACVGAALQAQSPAALIAALEQVPLPSGSAIPEALRAGLTMLAATGRFAPDDLRYDAFVGDAAPAPAQLSPSRLERLAACPQHYFFRHVLHVDEMEEVREGYEFEAREIGARVHAVLHDVYAGLAGTGGAPLAGAGGAAPAGASAAPAGGPVERLREAWARHTRDIARRTTARYPLLWETTERLWLRALEAFLREDMAALRRDGGRVLGLEQDAAAPIVSGSGGRAIVVRGRFDRTVLYPEGVVVSDYKTSGDLEQHVSPASILKGLRLQLPLYLLVLEVLAKDRRAEGHPVRADILGVGPSYQAAADADGPAGPETGRPGGGEAAAARVSLDMDALGRLRPGLEETLRVLAALAEGGRFPLNAESGLCRVCPYLRACRRWHVPTTTRVESAPGAADYMRLRRKNSRRPTLAAVLGAEGREEGP